MLVNSTPVEAQRVGGREVLVKREDLCCPDGPPFSKIRGVMAHIAARDEARIAALDTSHSMAGWAVAYACRELGRKATVFYPLRKAQARDHLGLSQQRAAALGADLIPLPAGRSAILYHRAKQEFAGYMMPNALKLAESVTENAAEARRTNLPARPIGAVVISVSSGTVASGVLRGLSQRVETIGAKIVIHMGYSRSRPALLDYMQNRAGVALEGMLVPFASVQTVDEGWGYGDGATGAAPFPCNPFYDLKAWLWLEKNIQHLREPVLFWNIGA